MKKWIAGFIVGIVLCLSSTAFAAATKQFIVTEAPYPIFVNGVEYKDKELPILNYEGSTYIPLAKIGDLLGVEYRWNDAKKRVEIGKNPDNSDTSNASSAGNGTGNGSIASRELVERELIKQFQENLKIEIIDEDPNKKEEQEVRKAPEDFLKLNEDSMRITEEWISSDTLYIKANIHITIGDSKDQSAFFDTESQKKVYEITWPEHWSDKSDQPETIINGIRVKRYDNVDYFNVEDLRKLKIIPEN